MGMIEVAYEIRELTDYFVASEETIPVDGFDYYTIISNLVATPTSPTITLIDFIIESYEDYYSIQSYSTTISAFNLSTELITDLKLSIDVLVDALLIAINDSYGSIIEEAFFNTQTFSYSYTIDLLDFLNSLANSTLQVNYPEIQAKILLLKTVLNKIIFQNYQHDSLNGRAHGASIFMPYYDTSYIQSIDDYISGVNSFIGMDWQSDTLWEEFLFYFYSNGFGQGIPGLIQIKFNEPTGTIAIDEDEEHLYYFVINNIGVYEITAEISSGDSDIYLIDYSSFSLLGYSLLVNPDDGNQEIMRFLLSPGTYLVEVFGFTTSVYNLEVTESEIPLLLFDSIITEESGTQEGTDDGHYLQTVSYFYKLIIPIQGSYEIRLLYDSSEVDFDLYVYSEDFTRIDYSINTGDLDNILLDIDEPILLFVKVYGYSGKGQFTLQVINKETNTPTTSTPPTTSPTPLVGLIIIPFIFLASSLVIILIYIKRKRQ